MEKSSNKYKLETIDFIRGLCYAVGTAIAAPFIIWSQQASAAITANGLAAQIPPFPPFNLSICLTVSLSAAIVYIGNKFFTNTKPQ